MSVLISAYQIEKSFGSRLLFQNITFAIETGDRIGLIGPNGAGKSTLLKILAQTEVPDSGKLSFARNLRTGYLSQDPKFEKEATIFSTLLAAAPEDNDGMVYAKIEELISLLSLDGEKVGRDTKVASLSGGWKKKVALACQLVKDPQLLLLDEPTNHLDLESIFWLEEFLNNQSDLAVLTITHDRLFLQNTSNQIFDLDRRYKDGLLKIRGDYSDYLESRDIILSGQKSTEEARRNDLRRETAWLRRGALARQTKQKARIERASDLKDEVEELRQRNQNIKLDLDLATGQRSPKKLIEAKNISKTLSGQILFKDFSITITPKSRIGLLGRNGCGKSTLIKTLLGEIKPDSGSVVLNDQIQVSYFEQHRSLLNTKNTLLKEICPEGDYIHLKGQPVFAKSYLHRFHFRPEQHDMPIEKLSGGEQSRLLIAKLMLTSANVLVLDEPTNDLDIATLDVLKEALDEFDGAVILVTHDRFFLEQVSDTIYSFTDPKHLLKGEQPGVLQKFSGYLQWQKWIEQRLKDVLSENRNQAKQEKSETQKSKKRKLSFNEQNELNTMEERIQKLELELNQLESESSRPEVISDAKKLLEISQKMSQLQTDIEKLYQRWDQLTT